MFNFSDKSIISDIGKRNSEAVKKAVARLPDKYSGILSQVLPKMSIAPVRLSAPIIQMMEAEGRSCGMGEAIRHSWLQSEVDRRAGRSSQVRDPRLQQREF